MLMQTKEVSDLKVLEVREKITAAWEQHRGRLVSDANAALRAQKTDGVKGKGADPNWKRQQRQEQATAGCVQHPRLLPSAVEASTF